MSRAIFFLILACPFLFACDQSKGDDLSSQPDVPITDPGTGTDPGTVTDPGSTLDPGTATDVVQPTDTGACEVLLNLPMASACETDCDCEPPLFCYQQSYPGAKGVCTRECEGSCGSNLAWKCLLFSPKHWKAHPDMTHHTICMPYCMSLADCAKFGDHFTYCPGKSGYTEWEGSTLNSSTCQVVKTE